MNPFTTKHGTSITFRVGVQSGSGRVSAADPIEN